MPVRSGKHVEYSGYRVESVSHRRMQEPSENASVVTVMVTCGTVLLLAGITHGWDLITLAVGIYTGLSVN